MLDRTFRPRRNLLIAHLAALLIALPSLAHEDKGQEKSIQAMRINPHPPTIDGVLDDAIWQKAPASDSFTQRDPEEGEAPTERTTVQLAYDDEALYIAVNCYGTSPDSVVARLSRRDHWTEMDWVSVNIDPHHDHQSGYWFLLGASGWQMDGILYDDDNDDDTWNGVWEGDAAIGETGWSAEYRIPYHVLRFAQADDYTWGINVQRQILRKEERNQWVMIPRGQSGWASRFGHIEGIKDITPPRHLEALPFALSRTGGGDTFFGSAGLDLRYGITPSISLNATVNPDFGQVEADPAVLNLSVFETFFDERRPFFIEGNTLFQSPHPNIVGIGGPAQLFYSRRVGRQPGRFDLPDDSEELHRPQSTTIIGAAKVSGKTAGRTSFGLLQAVTADENARITDAEGNRRDFRVDPLSNHLVGRIEQDLQTNSSIGATFTAVNGRNFGGAYAGSVDGTLKWKENAYRIFSRLSTSSVDGDDGRSKGYEGVLYFSKFSGNFGGQAYADARSPGFEVNELGFMNRNDRIQTGAHIYAQIQKPWALARQSGFNLNTWSHWNYDGDRLARGLNFNNWHQLKNYWSFNFGINRDLRAQDDLGTRGGPVMEQPAGVSFWSGFSTDDRKAVSLWANANGSRADGAFGHSRRFSFGTTYKPASNLQFEIGPSYNSRRNFAQWVDNVDTDGDSEDDAYVFGELDSQVLDLTVRAQVAFSNRLTLQGYLQSFVTAGDYKDFKQLARPYSYEFLPFTYEGDNPDFDRRSLRSNLVLRWEYEPGSTLFLVWSQSRSASFDEVLDPDFSPLSGVGNSFTDEGDNLFFIKLNYWSNI